MVHMFSMIECFTINECLNQFYILLAARVCFDEVFDSVCSNHDVYEGTTKPLVQHVLQGCVKIDINIFLFCHLFIERLLCVCDSLI